MSFKVLSHEDRPDYFPSCRPFVFFEFSFWFVFLKFRRTEAVLTVLIFFRVHLWCFLFKWPVVLQEKKVFIANAYAQDLGMVSRSSLVERLSIGHSVCGEAKAICCWSIDNFPSRPVSCSAGLIGQFSISQRSSRISLHLGSFCKHTIILQISRMMRTWRGIRCGERFCLTIVDVMIEVPFEMSCLTIDRCVIFFASEMTF